MTAREQPRGPQDRRPGDETRRDGGDPHAPTATAGATAPALDDTAARARWPTSTTYASGMQREVDREERETERAAPPRRGLPVVDNLERALSTPTADDCPSLGSAEGAEPCAIKRSPGAHPVRLSPLRGRRRAVRPAPPRGGRRVDRSRRRRAPWWRWCRPGYGHRRRRPAPGRGGRRARPGDGGRRDYYEVLGVGRDAAGRHPAAPTASWPAPTTPTSTRTQAPRTASRRSSEAYDVLSTQSPGDGTTTSGTTSARCPRAWDPAARGCRRAGRRRRRAGRSGRARARPGPRRRIGFDGHATSTLRGAVRRRLLGGARRSARGPILAPTRRRELDADRRGGLPGRSRSITLSGRDGPRTLRRRRFPAGVTRRAAHPAGRPGRPGQRRRGRRGPLPGGAHRPAPPLTALDGRDVTSTCRSPPWEAALGAIGRRRHSTGEAKVRVPAGTSSGRRLRLQRPRPAQPARRRRATCTRRYASWCRKRSQRRRSGGCSRSSAAQSSTFDPEEAADDDAAPGPADGASTLTRVARTARAPSRRWCAAWSALGLLEASQRRAPAVCGSPRPAACGCVGRASGCAPALGLNYAALGLRRRPARPHRRAGATAPAAILGPDRRTTMDMNRLTQKSQEALHDAQTKAPAIRPHRGRRRAPAARPARPARGLCVAPLLDRAGADPRPAARGPRGRARAAVPGSAGPAPRPDRCIVTAAARPRCSRPPSERPSGLKDEYVSVEHLVVALARRGLGDRRRPPLRGERRHRDSLPADADAIRGNQRVTSATPEGTYEALEKYGRDLVADARGRQARPGDRPRRRDPPHRPDPVPQDARTTRC